MSNTENPSQNQKEQGQQQQDRTNAIKELAKLPRQQLDEQESKLWAEKQKFSDQVLPQVAQQRMTMRILKQDLDKYGKVENQYKEALSNYETATKEAHKQEQELNLKIQNVQAAKQVQVAAKDIPVKQDVHDQAVKAALEGQKPFTPQITPDQSFSIQAATQAYHNETSKEPDSAQVKGQKQTTTTSSSNTQNTQISTNTGKNVTNKGNNFNEQVDLSERAS